MFHSHFAHQHFSWPQLLSSLEKKTQSRIKAVRVDVTTDCFLLFYQSAFELQSPFYITQAFFLFVFQSMKCMLFSLGEKGSFQDNSTYSRSVSLRVCDVINSSSKYTYIIGLDNSCRMLPLNVGVNNKAFGFLVLSFTGISLLPNATFKSSEVPLPHLQCRDSC